MISSIISSTTNPR